MLMYVEVHECSLYYHLNFTVVALNYTWVNMMILEWGVLGICVVQSPLCDSGAHPAVRTTALPGFPGATKVAFIVISSELLKAGPSPIFSPAWALWNFMVFINQIHEEWSCITLNCISLLPSKAEWLFLCSLVFGISSCSASLDLLPSS